MELKQILRFDEYDFSEDFLFSVLAMVANVGDPKHLSEIVEIEEFLEKKKNNLSFETIKYIHSFKKYILDEWKIFLEDEAYYKERK